MQYEHKNMCVSRERDCNDSAKKEKRNRAFNSSKPSWPYFVKSGPLVGLNWKFVNGPAYLENASTTLTLHNSIHAHRPLVLLKCMGIFATSKHSIRRAA